MTQPRQVNQPKYLKTFATLILGVSIALVGCSDDTEGKESKSTTDSPTQQVNKPGSKNASESSVLESEVIETDYGTITRTELNQEILDSVEYKIVVKAIEHTNDPELGRNTNIVFDVTNRLEVDLTFQVDNLSTDGETIPDEIYGMSQDVSAGKTTSVRLSINEVEGVAYPTFTKNIKLNLDVFNWDDVEIGETLPIEIALN